MNEAQSHAACAARYKAMKRFAASQFAAFNDLEIGEMLAQLSQITARDGDSKRALARAAVGPYGDPIHTAAVTFLLGVAEERRLAHLRSETGELSDEPRSY